MRYGNNRLATLLLPQKEIDDISAEKGLRPFEYLDKIGFLGPDVVAAHCVWLSDDEIEKALKDFPAFDFV